MRETTTAPLRHVPVQFATRTVDPTGLRDRTAPTHTPTVNMAINGARRITASTQQESNVTQQIVAQYLMLVGR